MSVTAFDVTTRAEPEGSRSLCWLRALFALSCLVNILLIAALVITCVVPSLLSSGEARGHSAEEIRSSIFGAINPDNIAANLRIVTAEPHVAGTEANARVADKLVHLWKENGLEDVHKLSYDVLLNYPDYSQPNHLSVINAVGYTLYETAGVSPDLLNRTDNAIEASIQWLAYSPAGTVQGQPVYCNYGRREDFERLAQLGIGDLRGKIAIMRYGKLFRGDKVKNAERMGAIGAVIYSDPMEVAQDGMDNGFPSSVWMPPEAVQRGSLLHVNGDPLSPLLPARRDFHAQYSFEEAKRLHMFPSIPVLPLSYGDALHILSRFDGEEVPQEWRGGLNFTQRLGPRLKWGTGSKLRVEVHSKSEVRQISNVVGYIRGSEAPDEWVLVGNHFDAWVFGAVDPNSGTAILAEMGRAFAETVRTKQWRPKRTLVFCQWDAEEFGLIGSTEFVEEFASLLQQRAVVYLNVDLISDNKTLDAKTIPSLYNAVTEAAKLVRNPMAEERNNGRPTVYDTWFQHRPSRTQWLPQTPQMELPGGSSDHMSFLSFLGIPVVDFRYRNSSTQYALYHTRYEVPFVNEHLFDVDRLAVHKAVGEYWAELARSFADSPLLPISAAVFSKKLRMDYMRELNESIAALSAQFPGEVKVAVEQLDKLAANVRQFDERTTQFEAEAQKWQSAADKPKLDWANRRLRVLEQCFVNPAMGLVRLGEPEKRHVLYSVSSQDQYSAAVMAAVGQKIGQVARPNQTEVDRQNAARELALELTVIQQAVLCATNTLSSVV